MIKICRATLNIPGDAIESQLISSILRYGIGGERDRSKFLETW